jgi:predicted AlkP superfamily pyrophosphatase or phosphodiesterase
VVDWSGVTEIDDHPIVPDYGGANVRGIIPALLGPQPWSVSIPSWMPASIAHANQVVLLVLDGLGWDQLNDHAKIAPTLSSLDGDRITTVAPTTTATALSSIATGLTPGEHGLIGYRIAIGGEVMNVLRWAVDGQNRRRANVPREIQRFPAFLGQTVPIVSPTELADSAFSEAHLRGGRSVGYRAPSSMSVSVAELLAAGERFVYAYYAGIDKIAHERGFGPYYDAELRTADRLVGDMLEVLPPGAALLITADHGQVQVADNIITPTAELLSLVSQQSGEGRFRWLHAHRGGTADLLAAATEEFGDTGWVRSREQLIDECWFGPTMAPQVAQRLGDVALVARDDVSYYDPDDSGPFALVCRHGSMTSAEVYVPLLAGMPR